MKSSFCIDLQRFMLIPTKFPLNHYRSEYVRGYLHQQAMCTAFLTVINNPLWFYPFRTFRYFIAILIELLPTLAITKASDTA